MLAAIDLGKVLWLDLTHTNAAVLVVAVRTASFGRWLFVAVLYLDGWWRRLQLGSFSSLGDAPVQIGRAHV